jgi:hypothetical protein
VSKGASGRRLGECAEHTFTRIVEPALHFLVRRRLGPKNSGKPAAERREAAGRGTQSGGEREDARAQDTDGIAHYDTRRVVSPLQGYERASDRGAAGESGGDGGGRSAGPGGARGHVVTKGGSRTIVVPFHQHGAAPVAEHASREAPVQASSSSSSPAPSAGLPGPALVEAGAEPAPTGDGGGGRRAAQSIGGREAQEAVADSAHLRPKQSLLAAHANGAQDTDLLVPIVRPASRNASHDRPNAGARLAVGTGVGELVGGRHGQDQREGGAANLNAAPRTGLLESPDGGGGEAAGKGGAAGAGAGSGSAQPKVLATSAPRVLATSAPLRLS